mmetsp:Transcript_10202/g.17184  ORF Transcript_10202/g.17184 Transcript_10202/m.17184 type:complete len:131 (-) Transcript_10202:237-629(-)
MKFQIANTFDNYPLMDQPPLLKEYIMVTLGYHIQKSLKDIFTREKHNDVYEVILHHLLTFTLYLGSYWINHLQIGALVVYSLDISEVFITLSKTLSETTWTRTIGFSGFMMLLTWWYFRVFAFPYAIYEH